MVRSYWKQELEENPDWQHNLTAANALRAKIGKDPVLLESIRAWAKEDEEDLGTPLVQELFVVGAVRCYAYLFEEAQKHGVELPSYTTLKQEPQRPGETALDSLKNKLDRQSSELMKACNLWANFCSMVSQDVVFWPPGILAGGLVMRGALSCYIAIDALRK